MGDEMEGPYKVVGRLTQDPRVPTQYMIVKRDRNDLFLREIIPNAGSGETAREVCNLLNKEWRRKQDESHALANEILEDLGHDPAD